MMNFQKKLLPFFSLIHRTCKNNMVGQQRLMKNDNKVSINSSGLMKSNNFYSFSSFFEKMDQEEMHHYSARKYHNKKYRGLIALWKKPLERKRRRQERIKEIKANLAPPKQEDQKLIIHNAAVGIKYPPAKNQIFCVVKIDGFQYKVTQDCLIILDTKQNHQINKTIIIDNVLLAATSTYTLLGRPFVKNTSVQGVVQSISDSQKTLVFKKKRRKQYKKSFGSRVKLTTLRITKIVHQIRNQALQKAVNLIEPPASQKFSLSQ